MAGGGAKPGERRGGRKPGVPNRRTVEVAEKLAELACDPIRGMAMLAMDTSVCPELRGRLYSELAQYVAPKRKAIEHSADMPALEALLQRIGNEP